MKTTNFKTLPATNPSALPSPVRTNRRAHRRAHCCRAVGLLCLFTFLLCSNIMGADLDITKDASDVIVLPAINAGDKIFISGSGDPADTLRNDDWAVLKNLGVAFHLELQTENKSVPDGALAESKVMSAYLKNVETIGGLAFLGCIALESVDLPAAVTIGNQAFYNCDALFCYKNKDTTNMQSVEKEIENYISKRRQKQNRERFIAHAGMGAQHNRKHHS